MFFNVSLNIFPGPGASYPKFTSRFLKFLTRAFIYLTFDLETFYKSVIAEPRNAMNEFSAVVKPASWEMVPKAPHKNPRRVITGL